jgi:DNA-binding transcriptional MerR regulator
VHWQESNPESDFHTTGQVAKILRVSVSTLKRWLEDDPNLAQFRTNASGWRLFSESEIDAMKEYRKRKRQLGRIFRPDTLRPINDD